jgi:hypothetical protein
MTHLILPRRFSSGTNAIGTEFARQTPAEFAQLQIADEACSQPTLSVATGPPPRPRFHAGI